MTYPRTRKILSQDSGRWSHLQPSNRAGAHLAMDVIRLADRERDDRQRRVATPRARELTAITDEQVLDVVRLTPPVANAVRRVRAHPARAHVVAVGKRWPPYDVFRISGMEDCFHGVAGMLQHRDVVRVILDLSDVRNGQTVLILDRAIQGDPRFGLRHIFSAGPNRDHM